MSCYLRNLENLMAEAGIELTKENRKYIDCCIRLAVGKMDAECPEVWREVKAYLADGRREAIIDCLTREYTYAI